MAEIKLSIVILNYHSAGLVKQCLRGIVNNISFNDYEIIVVDNNSQDNLLKLQVIYPQVKFILLPSNHGFAAGNNAGLREAGGRYILVLNPDIAVLEGSIEKMISYLDNNLQVGMVVPQLLNPDRSIQYSVMRFPKWWLPLFRRTFLGGGFKAQQWLAWYLMKDWDHLTNHSIDWALGACMLVRSETLASVGLLDERYFLYVEDTDWCRRFWQNNWEIHYVAGAQLIHYHRRESADKFFSKLNFIHLISWFKYFWKFKNSK
ncbi:MAG: glycosyltransferase family 2 protein [Candidatus Margulisiibacteriota bacterium]|jgi:hypothetical protein